MDFFRDHILSIITYTPLLGALVLLLPLVQGPVTTRVRWFANGVRPRRLPGQPAAVVLVRPRGGRLPVRGEGGAWIPSIGVSYHFGIDGVSALLILLTTLLGFIAILSSWTAVTDRVRQYYVFLLLLQTGMLGVFCALDMFLFYVFWEVMLVPMYFLIGIWGGARRLYARHQVLPLHPGRLGGDAARDPGRVLPDAHDPGPGGDGHVRPHHAG